MTSEYQLIIHVTDHGGLQTGNVGHTFVELRTIDGTTTNSIYRGKWPTEHGINSLYSGESIHDEAQLLADIDAPGSTQSHIISIPITISKEQYDNAMFYAHGYDNIPADGIPITNENYIFLSDNCADFAQMILHESGQIGDILDYFTPNSIGFDSPVETYINLSWGTTVISDVQSVFLQLTSFASNGVTHVFQGIEGLISYINDNFSGSINGYFADSFGTNKVIDTHEWKISGIDSTKAIDAVGGTPVNQNDSHVYNSNNGSAFSIISGTATTVVNGVSYGVYEVANSLATATTAMANFISKQVSDGISWFAREDSSIQLSIANWLAGNLGNLINGQMSLDAAFISLAKYVAIQEGSSALAAGISSVSGAQNVLAGIFKDAGVTGTRTVNGVTTNLANDYAVSVYTALSRMAVDFALNSQGWDAGQYRAANDNCNYEIKIAA